MTFHSPRGCTYLIMHENIYLFTYAAYAISNIDKFWFCAEKENKMTFSNKLTTSKK